ncbi:hypothetical protein BC940DRAFT_323455 [Gongronella butleri]|nr:hypothetical protein BC940DRAFT_323455 [Gongronella butleri]
MVNLGHLIGLLVHAASRHTMHGRARARNWIARTCNETRLAIVKCYFEGRGGYKNRQNPINLRFLALQRFDLGSVWDKMFLCGRENHDTKFEMFKAYYVQEVGKRMEFEEFQSNFTKTNNC